MARWPIFFIGSPKVIPSAPLLSRNADTPEDRLVGSVLANTTYCSAAPALEIQDFCPLIRYPPSTRVAVVLIEAASDPASGSVVASAVITALGPVTGVSQRFFCSSVPSTMMGSEKNPLEH